MGSIRVFAGIVALSIAVSACTSEPVVTRQVVDEGEVGRPTVALAVDGSMVYWAWFRNDADGWNVYVAAETVGGADAAGGGLSGGADAAGGNALSGAFTPVRVNHIPGNANPHAQAPAQVAVAPDGRIYVLWTNRIEAEGRRFAASNLLVSVSTDGGQTFSAERAINNDAGGRLTGHTFHNVTILSDGTVLASWIDGREHDRAMAEAGLTDMDLIAATTSDPASDHEAMHGVGMAAAMAASMPGSEIRVARSTDGGLSWTETAVVDQDSCPCCRTDLTTGPDGAVYLAWRHVFDGGERDIVVARSDDGGRTFGAPVRVHEDAWRIDACPHAGPSLATTADGTLHVVWYTGADGRIGVYRSVSRDGGRTFEEPQILQSEVPVTLASLASVGADAPTLAVERALEDHIVLTGGSQSASVEVEGTLPSVAAVGTTTAMVWLNGSRIEGLIRSE